MLPLAGTPAEMPEYNGLHQAARAGSTERTLALLSSGSIDINQGSPQGVTPLMVAALKGYASIVRILLNHKADVSLIDDEDGCTALHMSATK